MLNKNDKIELSITGITTDGNGVGRVDGYAVFVPKTCVGDVAEVIIVKPLSKYAFGRAINIIKPSEDRTQEDCESNKQCGGCSLRHVKYEAECRYKKEFVQNNMKKLGNLDVNVLDTVKSEDDKFYRNKALYPVRFQNGKIVMGFFAKRTHTVVPCEECLLHPKYYKDILNTVKRYMRINDVSAYDEERNKGLIRHVFIRSAENTGEVMACIVVNGKSLPNEKDLVDRLLKCNKNIKSIIINTNKAKDNVVMGEHCRTIYGKDYITDILAGIKVNLSPLSFYQVNHNQAEFIYNKAKELAQFTGEETVLDLYCGAGTIGLSMAKDVKSIIGVEIVPEAIKDAQINAEINEIKNAEFICSDAGGAALKLAEEGILPDVVIIDPPRKGCSTDVIEAIKMMKPKQVIMISCNSATAARDCSLLQEAGYNVGDVQPVDMFPRTTHVECIVGLQKSNKQ